MDESSQAIITFLLFADLFLNWSKAVIAAAIAVVIRSRAASLAAALVVGGLEGLLGSRLELIDIYLSSSGWQAIDVLTLVTVALSALAGLLWWAIARGAAALVRRAARGS